MPAARELLEAWERGLNQSPIVRALLLLADAYPEETPDELADLPVGERDRRLLDLRGGLFGPRLTIVAACPACREKLEADVDVADIRLGNETASPLSNCWELDDYRIAFRLPTSSDVLAAVEAGREHRRKILLERCLIDVRANGEMLSIDALPGHVVEALIQGMAARDPQADLELRFSCSACPNAWGLRFDIASFLWQEVDSWAQRLLRDVARLARAFGWRETDVLALSPTRRQIYMELCGA